MIDTHAHIDFDAFDEDREEMIARAFESGVEYIMVPGVEPKDYNRLLELTDRYSQIYCGMGVHPHNASDANEEVYELIKKNSKNENVKAIGEIGLDYFYDFTPKDVQQEAFRRQLQIAKEVDLPVIVHNREADEDVLRILNEEKSDNLRGVLHCFSSDVEVMKKAVDMGFHVSFTGNITFKKSTLSNVVAEVPNDRVMIETDSPFMAPVPKRGKRNEPANVKLVAEKISEIKSISLNEVIKMTTNTAKKLFNLTMLLLMFGLTMNNLNAQEYEDEEYYDEYEDEFVDEDLEHPYPKFIGFGPMFGTNTVVETYFEEQSNGSIIENDKSYDGLFAIGGAVSYSPLDFLVLELSYNYSKNTKIVEEQDGLVDPSIYQNIELSTHWVINPYSRINFYGAAGVTAIFNEFNNVPDNQIGWHGGLGFYINMPSDYGLFNIVAEWRVSFETQKKKQVDLRYGDPNILTDTKSFYSIPRVYILYYPPF